MFLKNKNVRSHIGILLSETKEVKWWKLGDGSTGDSIYKETKPKKNKAVSTAAAYQVHSCLKDSLSKGTGKMAFEKYGLREFQLSEVMF